MAIGLNHETAPVELRERLAMPQDLVGPHLTTLLEKGYAKESVILSTCNRVEVYALVDEDEGGQGIRSYLSGNRDHAEIISKHLYHYEDEEAVRHLFRVASSLDSLVVGEPQILGQLKEAYDTALSHHSAGQVLGRVMRRAISVGKKVRTDTAIGGHTVSVGTAGVDLAEQVLGTLADKKCLIFGAGEVAELVAVAMQSRGIGELQVINRTLHRAEELAKKVAGVAHTEEALLTELEHVDIAVTSTAAQTPVLTASMMAPVLRKRKFRPLFLLDLSVPRNISEDVNGLEGAYVFNIDDLQDVAQRGLRRRSEEAQLAEVLVENEASKCFRSLDSLNAGPFIAALTQRAEDIVETERQRSHKVYAELTEEQRSGMDAMHRAMVKRLLHEPIAQARKLAEEGRMEELLTLGETFGIHPLPADRQASPVPEDETD
ncbi:MAG: glutamyl-tRNA reductase [Myxococcota bacterium]|nr:glutamyl-tRNA reductase [Myxococcota bacterium]